MASAMVNNPVVAAPEGYFDPFPSPATAAGAFSSYGWLSPRSSFSHDFSDDDKPQGPATAVGVSAASPGMATEDVDLDFEFVRVNDPVAMLPADELFSEGKLVPRRLAPARPRPETATRSPAPEKTPVPDPYAAISPKAPTCTSRWRELLRLRKAAQGAGAVGPSKCSSSSSAAAVAASSSGATGRSLKQFLHRNPRSSPSSANMASDSIPIPSRPRLSLDADKPGEAAVPLGGTPARLRLAPRAGRHPTRRSPGDAPARSASVDSPRVNSSGKVVFQGMGRSSSIPGALHSGPRGRHRGAERPHAATAAVRVAPVLNVAVCSLRGSSTRSPSASVFGLRQLFSAPQRKDSAAAALSPSSGSARGGGVRKIERAQ